MSIRLWHEGEYVAALTLAGAAEEILGKRLRKAGLAPFQDSFSSEIVEFARRLGHEDPRTDKLLNDLLNSSRNELKHYDGDEALIFDLRADASEMLERALFNYRLLTGVVPEEALLFWASSSDT